MKPKKNQSKPSQESPPEPPPKEPPRKFEDTWMCYFLGVLLMACCFVGCIQIICWFGKSIAWGYDIGRTYVHQVIDSRVDLYVSENPHKFGNGTVIQGCYFDGSDRGFSRQGKVLTTGGLKDYWAPDPEVEKHMEPYLHKRSGTGILIEHRPASPLGFWGADSERGKSVIWSNTHPTIANSHD